MKTLGYCEQWTISTNSRENVWAGMCREYVIGIFFNENLNGDIYLNLQELDNVWFQHDGATPHGALCYIIMWNRQDWLYLILPVITKLIIKLMIIRQHRHRLFTKMSHN